MSLLDRRDRDPLAIAIAVIGILFQLGVWVYWGGRLTEHMDEFERRLTISEAQMFSNTTQLRQQQQDIAVLSVKLDAIQNSIDNANRKLDRR